MFKDIMKDNDKQAQYTLFGGKIIVLGGDFRQILPVIVNGARTDIVLSSLKHSYIWPHVDIKHLSINMRALLGSKENQEKQKEFVNYLLRIGNGEETNIKIKINDEIEEDLIQVQDEMICKSKNLDD